MLTLFFFKQKTAYGMRISDWSSDVCSSDLDERARHRRAHDDAAARQALADIVVGVAEHLQSDALAKKGAERLARSAAQAHLHMLVGEAFHPDARGDFGRQARADRAVRPDDRRVGKEGGRKGWSRGSPVHYKTHNEHN